MKKLLLLTLFSISTILTFSQAQIVIRVLGNSARSKIGSMTKSVLSKEVSVFSKQASHEILERYGLSSNYLQNGYRIVHTNGQDFLVSKIDLFKYPAYAAQREEIVEKMVELKPTEEVKLTYDPKPNPHYTDILKIQYALKLLGYDLKPDGIMGNITKGGIEKVFGISCQGKTQSQIIKEVKAISHAKAPKPPTTPKYTLTISGGDGPPIKKENLTLEDLKKELSSNENITCGFEEVCANVEESSADITFACKDPAGNKVSINIFSEGSVEL
ncbi:MAG TPA: hypothetical protein VEA37_03780, partial [Flavobacterium sp.]|nr:hypothetical protein [Flavobacterium sp.]